MALRNDCVMKMGRCAIQAWRRPTPKMRWLLKSLKKPSCGIAQVSDKDEMMNGGSDSSCLPYERQNALTGLKAAPFAV